MIPTAVDLVNSIERLLSANPDLEITVRGNRRGEFFVVAFHLGVFLASSKANSLNQAFQGLFKAEPVECLLLASSPPKG